MAIWQAELRYFHQKAFYTIQDLDKLFAAVNYAFQQCQLQIDDSEAS
jgi:hypothetical protein